MFKSVSTLWYLYKTWEVKKTTRELSINQTSMAIN